MSDKYHQKLEANERLTRLKRVMTEAPDAFNATVDTGTSDSLKAQLDAYIKENATINKVIEELNAELKACKQACNEVTHKYADMCTQGEHLLEECESAKAKLESKTADYDKLKKEVDKLKGVVAKLTST
jgi:chromosome segregation ATPase